MSGNRNTMADLPQTLIGEFGRTTGMFLAWSKKYKWCRLIFIEKDVNSSSQS